MIMIETNAIAKEDITPDVLFKVAQEILKDCTKERAKEVKETLHKSPSLEEMKFDLEIYNKIAQTLSEKIKEEEAKRKKDTHHLIEKKIRTTTIRDAILYGTNKEEYNTQPKKIVGEDEIKYTREGNKTICKITNELGVFHGFAYAHTDGDEYDYSKGMTLAHARAMRELYKYSCDKLASMM